MQFDNLDFDNMSVDEIYEALKKKEAAADRIDVLSLKIEALEKKIQAIPDRVNKAVAESPTVHIALQVFREFLKEIRVLHLEVTGKEPDYKENFKWIESIEKQFALKN